MGNNNLKTTNDILVKVDQNNLIYIDPNSVLINGAAQPRAVEPENLMMYVNLEADLVPRSILVNNGAQNKLMSIAHGTLNFLQKNGGGDYDTTWTDAYTGIKPKTSMFLHTPFVNVPLIEGFNQNDGTGQSFGIDNISIQITGANFIPRVVIKFIDVRGKTLFESPENSPYGAFFHLPWPIFYLTIKGYYGKAIKYRLHMVKFNTRYDASSGNFEITTNFVGSTYAYLADISLESVLNAPYFYASENVTSTKYNEKTKYYDTTISKTTKGYRTLKSVYQEYINKGLLPKNFPVKTLREIIIIAGRLNKILEDVIFNKVIDPKTLAGVKEYEGFVTDFEQAILAWKSRNLSPEYFTDGTNISTRWFKLSGINKNVLDSITGLTTKSTLENLINNYVTLLEKNVSFGTKINKPLKDSKIITKTISCTSLKNIKDFYIIRETVGVDIDGLLEKIYIIQKDFIEQRNKLETEIEEKMNDIVKDPDPKVGIGFEPTIRNIIGVILANAETYIRLMKDVHYRAFDAANVRKKILSSVLTDSDKSGDAIYPWPEIKAQTAGGKELVLMYPGSKEMIGKLQADNKTLWPEVDFVENFYEISTKKSDPLTGKEGNVDNINYIFDSTTDTANKDLSVLTNIMNYIPYSDKSFSSILYEIYERAKYTTSLSPFSNDVILELADVEYSNLKDQVIDDIDIMGMLKNNITSYSKLLSQMEGTSTYDRYPYYQDQLPTVSYIKDGLDKDFIVQKYDVSSRSSISNNDSYSKLSQFLSNYKPEPYRKFIYPFNSPTYLSYVGQSNLLLNGMLFVNNPYDFITSPANALMWVKDSYSTNLFNNIIKINGTNKHILNTPYFHKQLYNDFIKSQSQEKYVGSAYLLLNSLPFKDLDDDINNTTLQYYTQGAYGKGRTLVSTIFREIGASHCIPYHMMLKWGSIYHRYKKWINDNVDIISDVTDAIDGSLYFDNSLGRIYTTVNGITVDRGDFRDVGLHPYYHDVFHQIVNGYPFFDPILGPSDYSDMIASGVTKTYYRYAHGGTAWASVVDNSKFVATDNRYTLLPSNGYNDINASNFIPSEQENFRTIWDIGTANVDDIDYTIYNFPSPYEYNKLTGTTDTYSLGNNYRKVIDLIATFKSNILDVFELAFLDFASEKLNEEISYIPYDVKYPKFQDLLKKIVSVTKSDNDPTDIHGLILTIKNKQTKELEYLSNELLSNDNLIKISLSNPREIDNYVLGGFTGVDVEHFSAGSYDESQYTTDNQKSLKLYLGEDLDSNTYYKDFFSVNDIELNEENIKQFRPLIYMYAGLRANGETPTKLSFVTYLKESIITSTKDSTTGVSGQNVRLLLFLDRLIGKMNSADFNVQSKSQTATIKRGYNDDPVKLELYNYFKSFNDKWSSGNSIGQRTLMEEFLFLDKANRDIGNSVFLDMEKLTRLEAPGNEKINLYSVISLLIQDTGFDIRALPAYVNFYGNNFSNMNRIIPSKSVARNMFGTFLDVDYQESSPKIILQYIGPTSKHLELSDVNNKYKYKDDGFNIGDTHNNPIIVAPDVFTKMDFSKSNKVVAFEVSFGDQNQSIFKGVELDQSSIKNTSESFQVLERLGRSETGASTAQIDIGLFDIYRQSSYQCQVTCMGNVMIQPTMYFYLKNIPLFKGSYWITEVTHNIKTTGIETTFKGTRIPSQSLPNPSDSFLSSYRSLFDRVVKRAVVKVKESELQLTGTTNSEKVIVTSSGGSYSYYADNIGIKGESPVLDAGVKDYGIPFNGFNNEKNIQLIKFNGEEWLRARAVLMGGAIYKIDPTIVMNIISRLTGGTITWGDVKEYSTNQNFYVSKFDIDSHNYGIKVIDLMSKYTKTEFLNPKVAFGGTIITVNTKIDKVNKIYEGPISVGPKTPDVLTTEGYLAEGYGIGLSDRLMRNLGIYDGDVVYFRLS